MKYYAQFYQRDLAGNVSEACGDRAVVILDGRCSKQWMRDTAESECRKRGYIAWRIFKGSFMRSSPISQLNYLSATQPVSNPSWLSAHGM